LAIKDDVKPAREQVRPSSTIDLVTFRHGHVSPDRQNRARLQTQ